MEEQKTISDFLEEAAQFIINAIEAVAEIVVAFVDMVCTSYKDIGAPFGDSIEGAMLWITIASRIGRRERELDHRQIQRELMLDAVRLGKEIRVANGMR